jgi:LacI family transcriptional regulator
MNKREGMPGHIQGRPTLRDVARLAGVSIPTVSRVVNKLGVVAPERQRAVEHALDALAYIPNHAARSLIHNASRTIGLIVPTIENPLFSTNIEAIEEELGAEDYGLLISCSQRSAERELQQSLVMVERGVDGLVLTGSRHEPGLRDLLRKRRIPFVCQDVSRRMPVEGGLSLPNEKAMAMAIDALAAAGHQRIAILTGPTHHTPPIADRVRGARNRLRRLGLPCPAQWIVEVNDWGAAAAIQGAGVLLSLVPRPTAIACTGDILTLGLAKVIRGAGLRVPDDMSIVGCGNTNMAGFADPRLSTVHMPFREMGQLAARRLLSIIKTGAIPAAFTLSCHFIAGDSIMPPSRDTT